ncbi:hypothetical protein M378DRAFT_354487 [Amanita muscaria Koide BX008]|uniref:Cytochrome P450 n=1 Tax=Amanita muscaria (strain Koide BX008) TaxID=946122 RepID=A0A0C2TIT9_AMAMK|nr:hypothetical protein M378DRAFT_354487 [Amanita muscaria Koide BX008]
MIDLSSFSSAVVLLSVLCFLSYSLSLYTKRPYAPYPPGPTPKPIIGNAMDMQSDVRPWLHYLEWSKRLRSDIVHMSAFNTRLVVLHKMEDAIALLEKRSSIYSDRPILPIIELLGMDFSTGILPHQDRWRRHRRVFQEAFRKDRIASYHHIITEKVHLFLGELLKDPSNFSNHCKWLAAALTFGVTFGYEVAPGQIHDRFIEVADLATKTTTELMVPGRTILNVLPFLGRIPSWVPGASTQRLCARVKEALVQYKTGLFEHAKNNLTQNISNDCVVETLLKIGNERNDGIYDDETIKDTMASTYIAGVETMQNAQLIFILSMALHPESQRKAQMEIDQFIGTDRLPTYEDRASLPYVEALYRELQRWRPVTPLAIMHTTSTDDIYKGFYIPKGTFVIPNVWAIARDEAIYQDPDRFMPERFFNTDGTLNNDTVSYAFGFGRRICAGKHVADAQVWLMVACTLATFDIAKAKDDNGNEIDIDANAFVDSIITGPLPFRCSIVPRSQQAETNIRAAVTSVTEA